MKVPNLLEEIGLIDKNKPDETYSKLHCKSSMDTNNQNCMGEKNCLDVVYLKFLN